MKFARATAARQDSSEDQAREKVLHDVRSGCGAPMTGFPRPMRIIARWSRQPGGRSFTLTALENGCRTRHAHLARDHARTVRRQDSTELGSPDDLFKTAR